MHTYKIAARSRHNVLKCFMIEDNELLAKLDMHNQEHVEAARWVLDLKQHGCRYSNQDSDILGAALRLVSNQISDDNRVLF